jgi:hypothetical protein
MEIVRLKKDICKGRVTILREDMMGKKRNELPLRQPPRSGLVQQLNIHLK